MDLILSNAVFQTVYLCLNSIWLYYHMIYNNFWQSLSSLATEMLDINLNRDTFIEFIPGRMGLLWLKMFLRIVKYLMF